MATLTIDGHEITIPDGRRLNLIQAARLAGIEIPHYCWHPGLSVVGSCRMCLVEVGQRDARSGKVSMQPKLVPACNTAAADGLVVVTQSEKVARARAMVEEDLLLRHPIDCPICDKAGECSLQDYHFKYGQGRRRADLRPFHSRKRELGDVRLFVDRCVMCTRCVRFCREVTGTNELMIVNRGAHEEIDVFAGFPLNNKLSGNLVDLCPVGALADKDFLYKQRVWFLRRHPGICTGCSVGCSIWIEEHQDRVYRIKPRENLEVNRWWICNDGRYSYPHIHDPRRIVQPLRRQSGQASRPDWDALPGELDAALRGAGRLGAVVSPMLTVEEAYLLASYLRGIDPQAFLALGPVPMVGEDERFPGGFTIAAEKCPNRRGVEAVVAHYMGRTPSFDDLLTELQRGRLRGVWVAGGYLREWIDPTAAQRFSGLEVLVVQDLFPSPLAEKAHWLLPATAFAEREGSYVNRGDRLQFAPWAVRPPAGVRREAGLYWRLLGRSGLYDARAVLAELAREILYFSAAAGGVPERGLDLKSNLLAGGEKVDG